MLCNTQSVYCGARSTHLASIDLRGRCIYFGARSTKLTCFDLPGHYRPRSPEINAGEICATSSKVYFLLVIWHHALDHLQWLSGLVSSATKYVTNALFFVASGAGDNYGIVKLTMVM